MSRDSTLHRRLGRYELLESAGEGAVGQVFRARDPQLRREVAIKVLSSEAAGEENTQRRFLREARAVSALNHPNICAIYDISRDEGRDFLVMEYLDGETLAARLERGPLPLADAIRYAIDIASALEAAHRQHIVHRDLKPANVMITPGGAKLLDFGMARLARAAESRTLTREGLPIGTLGYMAPEQINGTKADARTDIFSLGVLLYEMITGRHPFAAEDWPGIIGGILFCEPPPVPGVAPVIQQVVSACLAKDPAKRIQSAHGLRTALEWIRDGARAENDPARFRRRRVTAGLVLAAAGVLAALWVFFVVARQREALPPTVSSIEFAGVDAIRGAPSVSPDGRYVAVIAVMDGKRQLVVRRLAEGASRTISGAEGVDWKEWAPDSESLLASRGDQLLRVELDGRVTVVTTFSWPRGATMNARGDIVVAPNHTDAPLVLIPADRGPMRVVSALQPGETAHRTPQFLPDGRHFTFFAARIDDDREVGRVCIGSLDSIEVDCPLTASSNAVFVAPSSLLVASSGAVRAFEFDPRSLAVGTPTGVFRNIDFERAAGVVFASASRNGVVVYLDRSTRPLSSIQWVDRRGTILRDLPVQADFGEIALSRDGRRLAATRDGDVWIYDANTGVGARRISGAAGAYDPVWSPDDRHVAFAALRPGVQQMQIVSASSQESPIATFDGSTPLDWSADGDHVLLAAGTGMYSLQKRAVVPVPPGVGDYDGLRFAPDGELVAFTSRQSGQLELYVARTSVPGSAVQVTRSGGDCPRWRGDGRELFFVSPEGSVRSVAVTSGDQLIQVSSPSTLFSLADRVGCAFDAAPDGQEFVVIRRADSSNRPLTLVTNWRAGLLKP